MITDEDAIEDHAEERIVVTPTLQTIDDLDRWNFERRFCSAVFGGAGVGKSTALRYIADRDRNALLIELAPAMGKLKAFLDAVARALRIHVTGNSIYTLQCAILNQGARDDERLLIDESQNLNLDSFRTALYIHEQIGIPILFVGNNAVLKQVNSATPAYEQISSRLARKVPLPGNSEKDFVNVAIDYGVEGMDAFNRITAYGRNTALRSVVFMLKQARFMAGPKKPIRLAHIEDSIIRLTGAASLRSIIANQPKAKERA